MVDIPEIVALQTVDLRHDAMVKRLQALDEESRDPPAAAALTAELDAQEQLLHQAVQERESAEEEAEATRTKIGAEDGKLYSGAITDSRELRALQEEVFSLRRHLKTQEESILAFIEGEEFAREAQQFLVRLQEQGSAVWSARQTEIQERRQTVSDEAAVVQRELDQQRTEMDSEDLAIYDHQRRLHPVAVAAVEGGVCGACRLSLPTTVLIRARRGTAAVHCPSCSCIVYVP